MARQCHVMIMFILSSFLGILILEHKIATASLDSLFGPKLPEATPDYLAVLEVAKTEAQSLRTTALALQSDIDYFKRQQAATRTRGWSAIARLFKNKPEGHGDVVEKLLRRRKEELQRRMQLLEERTEVLVHLLAKLGEKALRNEDNMNRHEHAAPALRDIIKWLQQVSHSNL